MIQKNTTIYLFNIMDKIAGPWIIVNDGPYSDVKQRYVLRSVPDQLQLVEYYIPSDFWKQYGNYYWKINDPELRELTDKFSPCKNKSQFSPVGGFVDNQTQAREILEGLLKFAGYKIVDDKYSVLT